MFCYIMMWLPMLMLTSLVSSGQVNWMSFEEMEQAFNQQPRMVFIDFWADWCGPCKRMDKYVFSNPEVVAKLNSDYYPVRMLAETTDTIYFGGKEFFNTAPAGKQPGFHQLAVLLGRNDDSGMFSLPTMIIYDEQLRPVQKYHEYLHSKSMIKALNINKDQLEMNKGEVGHEH